MRKFLILSLLLWLPAWGEEVVFVTDYPLQVWAYRSVEGWAYLGETNSPLRLELDPRGPMPQFKFLPEGARPENDLYPSLGIPPGQLTQGRWPHQTVHRAALPSAVRARLFLRHHLVLLTSLGLLLVGVLWWAKRFRRRYTAQLTRAQALEDLSSGAGPTTLSGARLGSWRLAEAIGRGGMGVVYRALPDKTLGGEPAAVKVLSPEQAQDVDFQKRFRGEIQIWMKLEHPGICRLLDFGESADRLYLVTELLEGEVLADSLQGGLEPSQAVDYLIQIASALDYAHGRGVIHRDIKPANLFCCRDGRIKVLDFGLAKTAKVGHHTASGKALGTPGYMAPEQIVGGELGPPCDQYALGITAYEMLAGQKPFEADDPMTLAFQHLSEPPKALREHRPDLASELEAIIMKMIEKDPLNRFRGLNDALCLLREL